MDIEDNINNGLTYLLTYSFILRYAHSIERKFYWFSLQNGKKYLNFIKICNT